jgi:hypothetical protein
MSPVFYSTVSREVVQIAQILLIQTHNIVQYMYILGGRKSNVKHTRNQKPNKKLMQKMSKLCILILENDKLFLRIFANPSLLILENFIS